MDSPQEQKERLKQNRHYNPELEGVANPSRWEAALLFAAEVVMPACLFGVIVFVSVSLLG